MQDSALVRRVEALTGRDIGLSENAMKALRMSRELQSAKEDFTLPTVQSLETFKGVMAACVPPLKAI